MSDSKSFSDFRIRFAQRGDVPLLLHFIRSLAEYEQMSDRVVATEPTLEKTLFDDRQAEVLIGEEGGFPVGFALFYPTYSTFLGSANLFLEDLFIEPAFRHRGYGKAMLAELAAIALQRGCRRIDWWCLEWNAPSIAFYRKIGALPVDEWRIFRLEGEAIRNLAEKP
ncbi:MAG TPA: GNAT family N-acetyltransferase [Candidatus Izemoplasmatales bacterium]|nr:GNAT family N-acetyltransferase [Bacillota bacterium]HRY77184.1 GNAT family N-acetyltransferase [Candidatus Izemoplasmatales bacterium]